MNVPAIIGLLGGLLVLAVIANRLSRWTRVPDVVVLLLVGLVVGPITRFVRPTPVTPFVTLLGAFALILVLFEGGLELNVRQSFRQFAASMLVASLAYLLSTVIVAFLTHRSLGLTLRSSILVGAVLGCTSSTVVLPVLQQIHSAAAVKLTLVLEAAWGDVLAVLTVGALLTLPGGALWPGIAQTLLLQIVASLAVAIFSGLVWSWALPYLTEARYWQALTFSIVLLLYAAVESFGGNGLIAVLGFGLTLSNVRRIVGRLGEQLFGLGLRPDVQHDRILAFHAELAFLVRTFFFVLSGVVVELKGLEGRVLVSAAMIAGLFFARWLAIQSSRWALSSLTAKDREALLWMFPRGLITVVLAFQVLAARGAEFSFLPSLAFVVVLATNLLVVVGSIRAGHPSIPAAPEPLRATAETHE